MANVKDYIPEVFDFEVNGIPYTVEFCREGLKEADSYGVLTNNDMGLVDKTAIVLYAGLKKNNPYITLKQAKRILDNALESGEYSLNSFEDIFDEFVRAMQGTFIQSTGKKVIKSRRAEVMELTKKGKEKANTSNV